MWNRSSFILTAALLLGCDGDRRPELKPLQADQAEAQIKQPQALPPAVVTDHADGPPSIAIEPITISTAAADIDKGKALFASKACVACHKPDDTRLVGPGLKGVTARRSTAWLQRMILAPDVMLREDATAKALLKTYGAPMPAPALDPKTELPALLAYLKSLE